MQHKDEQKSCKSDAAVLLRLTIVSHIKGTLALVGLTGRNKKKKGRTGGNTQQQQQWQCVLFSRMSTTSAAQKTILSVPSHSLPTTAANTTEITTKITDITTNSRG